MRTRIAVFGLASGVLAGCVPSGDYYGYSPSYSSSPTSSYGSSSSTPDSSESWSHTSVRRDGTIVEDKGTSSGGRERTVVHPDGSVSIIQRDSDGTRTYVDSNGNVRVDPPHGRW